MQKEIDSIPKTLTKHKTVDPIYGISHRDLVKVLVDNYKQHYNIDFRETWNILYAAYDRKFGVDVKTAAKSRSFTNLDYIESEGKMEQLLEIARVELVIV